MQVSGFIILLLACSSNIIATSLLETGDPARIVNGYEVDIKDVPYQASLRRNIISGWAHMCGAIVITNRGILTAAHCVEQYVTQPSSLRVVVGTSNRLSGGKTYDISLVIVHADYSSMTMENDIALLGTAKKISFSQSVGPISVATPYFDLPPGTEALVSGFGTTSYEGLSSSVLLATRVNILAQESCARAYLRIATISTGMLCANASNPSRDACQGDSGGPLVANNHLVGIVSWGEGCANTVYPGVYTRVSEYYSWIWQNIDTIYQN